MVDSKLKKARESIVAKLLEKDGFGKAVKPGAQTYADLTTKDLGRIAEQLVVRLNLFGGEYPSFLPQLIRGVMEHPNLSKSDHSKIDTFCQMFELDWRGDRSLENKEEYLATHPIYLSEIDKSNFVGYGIMGDAEVTALLKLACVPFVSDLTNRLTKAADAPNTRGKSTPSKQSKH